MLPKALTEAISELKSAQESIANFVPGVPKFVVLLRLEEG